MDQLLNEAYEIRQMKYKRQSTDFIIINQMKNFFQVGDVLDPNIMYATPQLTFPLWERYFHKDISPRLWAKGIENSGMPMHYFVEQVLGDYQVTICSPSYSPSYYLDDLADKRLIPAKYARSIMIGVAENFSYTLPKKRLWEIMAYRLLGPLMVEHKGLEPSRIVYIDEIINMDLYNKMYNMGDIKYDISPGRYFKKTDMLMKAREHYKVRSV